MQKLATVSQETKQPQRKNLKILTDIWGFSNPCVLGIPKCSQDYQIWCTHSTWSLGLWFFTDFIPMIKLCYMAQLTWRQGDYLGGPDLLWANEEQRDFFARLEKRKSEIQSTRQIPCALLTWRWRGPHDKQCGQPPGESRPSRQSIRKLIS